MILFICISLGTSSAPGRVLSAPISTISAPCSNISLACATAFSKCLERYFIKDDDKTSSTYTAFIQQKETTDSFLEQLSALNGCTIIPPSRLENKELFSPYVVQAAFNKIPGNVMLRALDSKRFYISTGSACSSKKAGRPVLEAMHITPDLRETSVRFSFGPHTTQAAVQDLFQAVKEITETFKSM